MKTLTLISLCLLTLPCFYGMFAAWHVGDYYFGWYWAIGANALGYGAERLSKDG